tara:strand:- start:795 stop:1310 length:516 start_codon:yes stop_codon:yes gene_type:complete
MLTQVIDSFEDESFEHLDDADFLAEEIDQSHESLQFQLYSDSICLEDYEKYFMGFPRDYKVSELDENNFFQEWTDSLDYLVKTAEEPEESLWDEEDTPEIVAEGIGEVTEISDGRFSFRLYVAEKDSYLIRRFKQGPDDIEVEKGMRIRWWCEKIGDDFKQYYEPIDTESD